MTTDRTQGEGSGSLKEPEIKFAKAEQAVDAAYEINRKGGK